MVGRKDDDVGVPIGGMEKAASLGEVLWLGIPVWDCWVSAVPEEASCPEEVVP